MIEQLCVEWLGYPPFVFAGGEGEDPLRLVVHKNPLAVPEAEFERLEVVRDAARIGAAFDTSGALLFDEDEREQMRLQAYSLAVDAIDAGDVELAKRHLMLSKIEWYPGHHLGRDWVTALCTWILDNHGVEHVWESVEVGYNRPVMGTVLGQIDEMPLRNQVEWLATLFHQHAMRYELIETEGGIEFHTVPCGSGGRLIDEGAYGPPKNLGTIEGPRVESFGLEEMPAYCLHCPATNKLVLRRPGRGAVPARRTRPRRRQDPRALQLPHLQGPRRHPGRDVRPGGRDPRRGARRRRGAAGPLGRLRSSPAPASSVYFSPASAFATSEAGGSKRSP